MAGKVLVKNKGGEVVVLKTQKEKLYKVKQQKIKLMQAPLPISNTSKNLINYA